MVFKAPGSPTLRALVEPFIDNGKYEFEHVELNTLKLETIELLKQLEALQFEEANCFYNRQLRSTFGNSREEIRSLECTVIQKLLETEPDLFRSAEVVDLAVKLGAIPDPAMYLLMFRFPLGGYGSWRCGKPVEVDVSGQNSLCEACQKRCVLRREPKRQEQFRDIWGSTTT